MEAERQGGVNELLYCTVVVCCPCFVAFQSRKSKGAKPKSKQLCTGGQTLRRLNRQYRSETPQPAPPDRSSQNIISFSIEENDFPKKSSGMKSELEWRA